MARRNKIKAKVRLVLLAAFGILIWTNQTPATRKTAASKRLTAVSSSRTIQQIRRESSQSSEAESPQIISKSFEGATNVQIERSDFRQIHGNQTSTNITFAVHVSNGTYIHCVIDIGLIICRWAANLLSRAARKLWPV